MAKFSSGQNPLAYAMIAAADRVRTRRDGRHPIEKYFLLWTAFSTIYTTIASQKGCHTELIVDDDGIIVTHPNGSVKIPEVKEISERDQLFAALEDFDDQLKHSLIVHPNLKFFLKRIPFWQGKKIETDAFGQRLNGVVDVLSTTSIEYPVWSPLDQARFEHYWDNPDDIASRDFLAHQIVDMLLTMRRNMMRLGNVFDDASDIAVFENGLPLVEMIVKKFVR